MLLRCNYPGDKALRELSSPGKSGALFFISHDDSYFIKTMRKHEVKLLLDFLPRYHYHTSLNPHTLLTKFYGLYRIVPKGGKKVRFVVMGNILSAHLNIHRRYGTSCWVGIGGGVGGGGGGVRGRVLATMGQYATLTEHRIKNAVRRRRFMVLLCN